MSRRQGGPSRTGDKRESIRDRRATQPPALFQLSPWGRAALATLGRRSLHPYHLQIQAFVRAFQNRQLGDGAANQPPTPLPPPLGALAPNSTMALRADRRPPGRPANANRKSGNTCDEKACSPSAAKDWRSRSARFVEREKNYPRAVLITLSCCFDLKTPIFALPVPSWALPCPPSILRVSAGKLL